MTSSKLNVLCAFIVVLTYSCRDKRHAHKSELKFKTENLQTTNVDTLSGALLTKNEQFIPLENSPLATLTQIDKIKFKNDCIYVLDVSGIHRVFVFDKNGKFLRLVGKRGKGPGKYIRLADFDVDGNGNVYLYDTQQMQMLVYNNSGTLVNQKKTPFRAESFNLLDSNKYMFSILKNSQNKSLLDDKVVITNKNFEVERELFTYTNEFLDNKFTTGHFTENTKGILYNKPVNDSLFLFNKQGDLLKVYHLNFGANTVPEEYKNDYEKLVRVRSSGSYNYMFEVPFLIKDYLVGNIFNGPDKAIFLYDLNAKKISIKKTTIADLTHSNINIPIGTIGDSIIVGYLDSQLYELDNAKASIPQAIKDHIDKGGMVISYYSLK
jgi:hypothetical protein